MQGLRVVQWCVAWREIGDGRGRIGGSLFKGGSRDAVRHTHDFGTLVTGGWVAGTRNQRRRGHGDAGVRHGHSGRSRDFFVLDGVHGQLVGADGGCVDGRGRVCGCVSSSPRICEVRIMMGDVMVVDIVEGHAAVLTVLVFDDRGHREGFAGSRKELRLDGKR